MDFGNATLEDRSAAPHDTRRLDSTETPVTCRREIGSPPMLDTGHLRPR